MLSTILSTNGASLWNTHMLALMKTTHIHKHTQMAVCAHTHSFNPLHPTHTHTLGIKHNPSLQLSWSLWPVGVTVAPQPGPSSTADVNEVPYQWLPWAFLLFMTRPFWKKKLLHWYPEGNGLSQILNLLFFEWIHRQRYTEPEQAVEKFSSADRELDT